MFTREIWKMVDFGENLDYLFFLLGVPFAFILDMVLLPLEIIAFIIHRIREGEWSD